MKTLIVTGGKINQEFLKKILQEEKIHTIIAVDNGLQSLHEIQIKPHYIIGDFDTVSEDTLAFYQKDRSIQIQKYNPIKDNTDTDMAIQLAIQLKSQSILIIGGIGSRIDHTLGNIQVLKFALDHNVDCKIMDEANEIELINQTKTIKRSKDKTYISLIPLTEKVENVTLKGFRYELENGTLTFGSSLGISNEMISEEATIEIGKGILIVIQAKD